MALGIGTVFIGYWIGLFGYCSLKGPNVGLIDLIVPGRLSGHVIPTSAGDSSGSGAVTVTPAGGGNDLTCAQIQLLSTSQIMDIAKVNPAFILRVARCKSTAPTKGATGGTSTTNPHGPGYDLGNLYG